MVTIAREVRASYAFVERNFNLVKRYWGWEIAWLIYSVAHALAIGFIGVGMGQISGQPIDTNQLVLYLLVGSLVWSYLAIVFEAVGDTITWERWEGTIEYTFMAPVSRLTHLVGTCLFAARLRAAADRADPADRQPLLPPRPVAGEPGQRGDRAGGGELQLRRPGHHGLGAAAALRRARRADGLPGPGLPAALLRRLLPDRGHARLDAGGRDLLAGHLRPERRARRPAGRQRRGRPDRRTHALGSHRDRQHPARRLHLRHRRALPPSAAAGSSAVARPGFPSP